MLDALHLIAESWDMVSEETIKNCFKHGGFGAKNDEPLNPLHDVNIPVDMTSDTFEEVSTKMWMLQLLESSRMLK